MSMWYADAVVLILKCTLPPGFTLIAVEKPAIVGSLGGSPDMSSSQPEVPGLEFSHAMTLVTGRPHGPAACAAGVALGATISPRTISMAAPTMTVRWRSRMALPRRSDFRD